jgi:general secretion pathway protein D
VKVTQEIPLITGSYSSSTASVSGTTSPFTTIQREEVGTILKVTPHISENDTVELKIEQEDSSPGAKLADSADISTNKRDIKTTILVDDGGIIVLGGLMKDTVAESQDSVPGLASIPIIGNLFKSRSGSRQKSNLLVFLRPKILRDQRATEATSASKYNEIRGEEESLHKGKITLLPGEKQPAIPPIPPGNSPPPSIRAPAGGSRTIAPAPQPAPAGAIAPDPQSVLPDSQRAAGTTQPVSPSQTDPVTEHAPER